MPYHLNNFKDRHQGDMQSDALDKKIIELSALIEISQSLNSTLNLKSILDNILLVPMGRMMISKGIILFEKKSCQYNIESIKGLPFSLIGKEIRIPDLPNYPVIISDLDKDNEWSEFFQKFKIKFLIPLSSSRDFKGILGFGDKITGQAFNEEEADFLSSLGNVAVQAIENALVYDKLNIVNRELDGKIQELNTLFEIGKELNRQFDSDKILQQLSYSLMGQLLINQFFVLLTNIGKIHVAYQKGSSFTAENLDRCMEICQSFPELSGPVLLDEDDEKFRLLYEIGVRAVVPMTAQSQVGGYIFLGSKLDNNEITNSNLEFLSTLANMAMSSLDNARLFKETLEKERMEEEMHLAKNIQEQLLPSKMPKLVNFDIHGLNIPSKTVGGDYFDVIEVDDQSYIFTIADVSGKGMPASLLMSNLQAGLKTLTMENYPPDQVTGRLNDLIFQNTSVDKYITFFILKLNTNSGEFEYVNAGHNPPYWFTPDGSYKELDKGGIILGMMSDMPYETGNGILGDGERITMFTDGVTEALSPEGEEYEEFRLIEFLKANGSRRESKDLVDLLIEELRTFTAGKLSNTDDITILTIQRVAD